MSSQTEKGYALGHELALAALESAEKRGEEFKSSDVFAGMITTILHALYFMAPTEEAAEEIIAFSTKTALEDWEEEKKGEG